MAGRILHLLPSLFRLARDLPGRVGDLVLGAISPLLDLALGVALPLDPLFVLLDAYP